MKGMKIKRKNRTMKRQKKKNNVENGIEREREREREETREIEGKADIKDEKYSECIISITPSKTLFMFNLHLFHSFLVSLS